MLQVQIIAGLDHHPTSTSNVSESLNLSLEQLKDKGE